MKPKSKIKKAEILSVYHAQFSYLAGKLTPKERMCMHIQKHIMALPSHAMWCSYTQKANYKLLEN